MLGVTGWAICAISILAGVALVGFGIAILFMPHGYMGISLILFGGIVGVFGTLTGIFLVKMSRARRQ